jgi:excinuclease UvrABC ATPase subunit
MPGIHRDRGARENNLKNVSVDIPAGVLTVITGVAGCREESSLIHGCS